MSSEDQRDYRALFSTRCKRKENRRFKKKLGAMCRVAFAKRKKVETLINEKFTKENKIDKKKLKRERKREATRKKKEANFNDLDKEENDLDLNTFLKEAEKTRRNNILKDAEMDLQEIEILEKKLGVEKKKKSKVNDSNDNANIEKNAEKLMDDLFSALDDSFNQSNSSSDESDSENGEDKKIINEDESNIKNDNFLMEEENESVKSNDLFENSENESEFINKSEKIKPKNELEQKESQILAKFDENILTLAKKAKMKTFLEKQIFCTIMSSTNEIESFENLKKLSISGPAERGIIYVCFSCSLLEANYNPYYAFLISMFCNLRKKRFRVTTQFALWDLIKTFNKLKDHKKINLAFLSADLLRHQSISLSTMKIIDLTDEALIKLLTLIMCRLLTKTNERILREIFMRVINSKQNQQFTIELEKFLSKIDLEECKRFCSEVEFINFQNQLSMIKRLFAY